jgi:hypothetical protein
LESIKYLKLKLLLLFVVPAAGLVFFSFQFVTQKFDQYQKTEYLDRVTAYVHVASDFVKELQKERGLSIASIHDRAFFKEELHKQRAKSDEAYRQFVKVLKNFCESEQPALAKEVIDRFARLRGVRAKIDRGNLPIFDVLEQYNPLIGALIASADVLKSSFVNQTFFFRVNEYATLLHLAEYNGQERALIAFLLDGGQVDNRVMALLYRLEAQAEESQRRFESTLDPLTDADYRQAVPYQVENRLKTLKRRIIYERNFHAITSEEWWRLSTRYIDALYRVSEQVLNRLGDLKKRLKEEAYRALWISLDTPLAGDEPEYFARAVRQQG